MYKNSKIKKRSRSKSSSKKRLRSKSSSKKGSRSRSKSSSKKKIKKRSNKRSKKKTKRKINKNKIINDGGGFLDFFKLNKIKKAKKDLKSNVRKILNYIKNDFINVDSNQSTKSKYFQSSNFNVGYGYNIKNLKKVFPNDTNKELKNFKANLKNKNKNIKIYEPFCDLNNHTFNLYFWNILDFKYFFNIKVDKIKKPPYKIAQITIIRINYTNNKKDKLIVKSLNKNYDNILGDTDYLIKLILLISNEKFPKNIKNIESIPLTDNKPYLVKIQTPNPYD